MPKGWLGSQGGSWEAADPGHKHQGQPTTQMPKGEAKLRRWFSNQDDVAPPGVGHLAVLGDMFKCVCVGGVAVK